MDLGRVHVVRKGSIAAMTISEEQTVVLIETALPIEGMGEGKVELIGRQ